jgi:hypothetical protein
LEVKVQGMNVGEGQIIPSTDLDVLPQIVSPANAGLGGPLAALSESSRHRGDTVGNMKVVLDEKRGRIAGSGGYGNIRSKPIRAS